PVDTSGSTKLCQDRIDLSDLGVHGLKQKDGVRKAWAGPSDRAPDHIEVAAHQDTSCPSGDGDFRRNFGRLLVDNEVLRLHERLLQPHGRHTTVILFIPTHMRTMEPDRAASLPKCEMQNGDVAEPD